MASGGRSARWHPLEPQSRLSLTFLFSECNCRRDCRLKSLCWWMKVKMEEKWETAVDMKGKWLLLLIDRSDFCYFVRSVITWLLGNWNQDRIESNVSNCVKYYVIHVNLHNWLWNVKQISTKKVQYKNVCRMNSYWLALVIIRQCSPGFLDRYKHVLIVII